MKQSDDGIGRYYDNKRKEALAASEALRKAKSEGADYQTIQRLERRLESARYVGD